MSVDSDFSWSAPAEQSGDGALDSFCVNSFIESGVALRLPPHSKWGLCSVLPDVPEHLLPRLRTLLLMSPNIRALLITDS